jgi:AAA ATPase-like protein
VRDVAARLAPELWEPSWASLAVLDEAIRRAVAGSVQVVALSGEGGIGKSRLASEGLRLARARGFRPLEGAAGQLQKDLSFAPIVEALRPLVAEAALVDGLSDLVRLFDGLRVPKPVSLGDTRLERTRMFEAARLLIERAYNRLPVAILLTMCIGPTGGIARNEEWVLEGEDYWAS